MLFRSVGRVRGLPQRTCLQGDSYNSMLNLGHKICILIPVCSLSCSPLYGRWSDVFGRKILLLIALCIFVTFSLGCALAQTMIQVKSSITLSFLSLTCQQLIIFRALQGVGGGGKIQNLVVKYRLAYRITQLLRLLF